MLDERMSKLPEQLVKRLSHAEEDLLCVVLPPSPSAAQLLFPRCFVLVYRGDQHNNGQGSKVHLLPDFVLDFYSALRADIIPVAVVYSAYFIRKAPVLAKYPG